VFAAHDVLLTPAMPTLPPSLRRVVGRSTPRTIAEAAHLTNFCLPWNITGQPAATVPAGFTGDGLPLAVQLVGRPNGEGKLLSLAAQLEAERPWGDRRPPES
jgi:amidase